MTELLRDVRVHGNPITAEVIDVDWSEMGEVVLDALIEVFEAEKEELALVD